MIKVVPIDPHRDNRYMAFIESHPDATIFHHPGWMRVLEDVYKYHNFTLACQNGQSFVGILPLMEIRSKITGKRAVALPFSDSCQPLFADDEAPVALTEFLGKELQRRHWKFIEIRGSLCGQAIHPGKRYKNHVLQLDRDKNALLGSFHLTRTRQSIRKFYKIGGIVERRTDPEGMKIFMRLNYLTRQKHGIPPQPDSFFRAIQKELISKQMGFVSLAVLKGRYLAASVFLNFKRRMIYKFAASDETKLRYHPNHGILWDAIQRAVDLGCTTFDFGRSDLNREGLINFKRSWGTDESDFQYMILVDEPYAKLSDSVTLLNKLEPVLKEAPIGLLKVIGRYLYRHMG